MNTTALAASQLFVMILANSGPRDELAEFQEVMRRQFSNTGTPGEIALVVLSLGGVILLLFLLDRFQQRRRVSDAPNHPHQLFQDLTAELDLSVQQRDCLKAMAAGLNLANPAVLLLCPALFDHYSTQWEMRKGETPYDSTSGQLGPLISQTRRALFGGHSGGHRVTPAR